MEKQTLWEGMVGGSPRRLISSTNIVEFEPVSEGLLANIAGGVWGFAKSHPVLTTIGALAAADAWKQYKNKIDRSVKFQAKDKAEKKSMEAVIAQMTKSGYTIVKQGYKGSSGYEWELYKK